MKQLKAKKCKNCGSLFTPFNSMQKVCGVKCASDYVHKQNEEKKEKEWRAYKKAWKEDNKAHPELVKEAEKEFNAYIRERDRNEPCISCGNKNTGPDSLRAHNYDSGHYRSKASAPHMRFNEDNAHKQCVRCNRDLSGNIVEYRKRLIEKIGIERLEAVENNNEIRKFTKEELKEIKLKYRRMTKRLKDEQQIQE